MTYETILYETILYEKTPDRVATITINRPQALNSFNRKMCEEFRDVWERIRVDPEVNAVVLRAAGDRAFSTGVDVRDPPNSTLMYEDLWAQVDPGEYLGPKHNQLWKPVITAVHGLCAAGGFYWVNESDIVICSEDAQFFEPHTTYGITAVLEPIGLRHRIPLSEVLRMVILGNDERIGAETALRISLVTEVVARDALWQRAHELAAQAAAKPTKSMQGSIRAIWESLEISRKSALQMGLKYCFLGNDYSVRETSSGTTAKEKKKFTVR